MHRVNPQRPPANVQPSAERFEATRPGSFSRRPSQEGSPRRRVSLDRSTIVTRLETINLALSGLQTEVQEIAASLSASRPADMEEASLRESDEDSPEGSHASSSRESDKSSARRPIDSSHSGAFEGAQIIDLLSSWNSGHKLHAASLDEVSVSSQESETFSATVSATDPNTVIRLDAQTTVPTVRSTATATRPSQAGCCDASVNMRQALAAFIPGFVSSAGFFVFNKDLPEAAVAAFITAAGHDPTVPPYSYIVAVAPGLWYGMFHQFVSRLTSGLCNAVLAQDRFSPKGATEAQRQWRELYSSTLPGLASYTLCHGVRGALTGALSDVWQIGFSKMFASSLAGGIGSVITNTLQQANPEHFQRTAHEASTSENLLRELQTLGSDMTGRKLGRDYLGKSLASPAALAAAVPLTPQELPGALGSPSNGFAAAALSKFIFQAGFYLGIHGGAALGNAFDVWRDGASELDDASSDRENDAGSVDGGEAASDAEAESSSRSPSDLDHSDTDSF